MTNALTPTGLTVNTQAELVAYYTAQFQSIYGTDINLDPDSPDGQMMNIFIQSVLDVQDLLVQIYSSFDPDNAIGVTLDQRVAINGIQRQAGTFSITNVTISTSRSVDLYGLDQTGQPVYTVADTSGTQWQLITTTTGINGTVALAFQAKFPGAIQSSPNSITVPVTVVLGVTSVNNPNTVTTLGINEESDAALKIRRQQSVSIGSQGYLAGLLGALENIPNMNSVSVYENKTGSTDANGVPGHSIWVIVDGAAAVSAIANAIYQKRNAGCGLKGSQAQTIIQADGTNFTVNWDNVITESLFIKFTATSLDGVNPPDIATIRDQLGDIFVPAVAAQVNINELSKLVQDLDSNTLVTSAGFSTSSGGSYTNTLSPTTVQYKFSVTSADIIILPIILNPTSATVVNTTGTVQFSALGGFGAYTYAIHTNVSGGSITSPAGLYTAGATPGTDVIRVTDGASNHTDVNVVVT